MREWLKVYRLNNDMTQDEIAAQSGISRSYYTHIEKGNKTPTVNVAKKIAQILNFKWTLFFEDD